MANKTLVENVAQVKADFKEIKDELINQGASISSNTPTSEYANIVSELADERYEAGKQAQYDEFWDEFQLKGAQKQYSNAFANRWNDKLFKPKYNMTPNYGSNMFYQCTIGNLEEILNECGVVLNTSKMTDFGWMFAYSTITHIPTIDMSKCTKASYTFSNYSSVGNTTSRLVSIRKVIASEKTVFERSTFSFLYHLTHCIFEGTIACNTTLEWNTKLSRDSILSLLQCLTAAVTDVTITLPINCIDGATDTLNLIQSDTELNTAYTQATANGYTIAFV